MNFSLLFDRSGICHLYAIGSLIRPFVAISMLLGIHSLLVEWHCLIDGYRVDRANWRLDFPSLDLNGIV